jgi:copper(I)-binding protein
VTGCGDDFDPEQYPSPGENARVGDILLRQFRLDPPPDDAYEPYPAGSDVRLYGTFVNEGDAVDRLLDVSSPDAADVELISSSGETVALPLELPAGSPVQMEPGELALLVKGTEQVLQSGSPIDLRLVFEHAGAATISVQVRIPAG